MPNVKLVAAVEHPIGCPTCGQKWHFVGDGLNGFGRYRAVHPPGPCVPRREPELFNHRVVRCRYRKCGREFEKHANGQCYCSGRCRDAERRAQMAEACRRYHERRKAVA